MDMMKNMPPAEHQKMMADMMGQLHHVINDGAEPGGMVALAKAAE